jgi:hypothetical protein
MKKEIAMRFVSNKPQAALALAVGLLLAASPLLAADKAPRLKFQEDVWNFGKIKEGATLSHEFVFKNLGDADLVIDKVRTSCGCTAALVSDKTVPPGREGKIGVSFDSRSYSGKVVKYFYVDSNDPSDPNKELSITADIEVPPRARIDIDPYNIDLGLLLEGEEIKGEFQVSNDGELELKVDCVHRDAKFYIKGKPAPAPIRIAAGKSVTVEFRVPAAPRQGMIREYILVKSNDPVRSTVSIYLSGFLITREQLKDLFKRYKNILKD